MQIRSKPRQLPLQHLTLFTPCVLFSTHWKLHITDSCLSAGLLYWKNTFLRFLLSTVDVTCCKKVGNTPTILLRRNCMSNVWNWRSKKYMTLYCITVLLCTKEHEPLSEVYELCLYFRVLVRALLLGVSWHCMSRLVNTKVFSNGWLPVSMSVKDTVPTHYVHVEGIGSMDHTKEQHHLISLGVWQQFLAFSKSVTHAPHTIHTDR